MGISFFKKWPLFVDILRICVSSAISTFLRGFYFLVKIFTSKLLIFVFTVLWKFRLCNSCKNYENWKPPRWTHFVVIISTSSVTVQDSSVILCLGSVLQTYMFFTENCRCAYKLCTLNSLLIVCQRGCYRLWVCLPADHCLLTFDIHEVMKTLHNLHRHLPEKADITARSSINSEFK